MMRAYSLTRIPEYRFERQFQLRPRLRAAGYARQAAHAGGFQRKGGGSAVRLYPLPGCLPDHAGRACASIKRLGSDAQHVQVVFVTVDPSRDTPEALERYVKAFGPNFSALRAADPAALRK